MGKMLIVTDALLDKASGVANIATNIQDSQTRMTDIFRSLGNDFFGKVPGLMVKNMLSMRSEYTAIDNILMGYKDFLETTAHNYEWLDKEMAAWARLLSADIANSPYYKVSPGTVNVNSRELYNDAAHEKRINCVYYARARMMEVNRWDTYPKTVDNNEITSNSIAWFRTSEGTHAVYIESYDPVSGIVTYSDSNIAGHKDGEVNSATLEEFKHFGTRNYQLINYEHPVI